MTVGSKAMVFFSGIPSDAGGPVVERVTPTLMSACAIPAALNNANAASLVSTENLRVDFILAVSLVDALVTSCLNDSAGGRPFLYFSEVTLLNLEYASLLLFRGSLLFLWLGFAA